MKTTVSRSSFVYWFRCAMGAIVVTSVVFIGYTARQLYPLWPDFILSSDFVSLWTGASLVRDHVGANLYDMAVQLDFQSQLRMEMATSDAVRFAVGHNPFHSPAPLALVLIPFTVLPMPDAYILWNAINLVGILAAVRPLLQRWSWYQVALVGFSGVLVSLLEGQVNSLFALAISVSLLSMIAGKPFSAGLALGFLLLKPQYAVVIAVVLLVKARWRELAGMAMAGAVFGVLFLLLTGLEGMWQYLAVLGRIGEFHPPRESMISAEAMVNWRGLFINLLPGLSNAEGGALVLLLGGATVALLLPIWRGPWNPRSPAFPIQMVATVMATLIAVPHSHFHGTVLLLPVVAMVIARWDEIRPWLGDWPIPFALGGYLLSMVAWPFRTLSWLLVIYFVAFLVIVIVSLRRSQVTAGPSIERTSPVGGLADP